MTDGGMRTLLTLFEGNVHSPTGSVKADSRNTA
jgi:hypothetical protein